MYTLTRNCRAGKYQDCACVPVNKPSKPGQMWRWSGCRENVRFGENMAKHFIDRLEKMMVDQRRAALNLHNNEVGRKVCSYMNVSLKPWPLRMRHVGYNIGGSCCNMFSRVSQINATLCKLVVKRTQHVACGAKLLHPFGQGFTEVLVTLFTPKLKKYILPTF